MGRRVVIGIVALFLVLICVGIVVGLVLGLRKHDSVPDVSANLIYTDIKETELINVDGVRAFGTKDFTGNVQSVHAIQTPDTIYMLDNNLLTQLKYADYSFLFKYNMSNGHYYVLFISENSSYQIPSSYIIPVVKFPEIDFKFPISTDLPDPFTGIITVLEDSVSRDLIPDATIELNYYDEQYGNRSVIMNNIGAGRYYASLPNNDTETQKYFDKVNLYDTLSQQSHALTRLLQSYPMGEIFSRVPQTRSSIFDGVLYEMNTTIPKALDTAANYANRFPSRDQSPNRRTRDFEMVIHIPGEITLKTPLNYISIDSNDLTVVSRQVKTTKGRCNELMIAGADTPDDRPIDIGKGHVAIKLHYETYTVKDQIDVYYTKQLMFSTRCVGTDGERVQTLSLDDDETRLRVKVTPNCEGGMGTRWYYTIECPHQDLQCEENLCYCGLGKYPSQQVQEPTVDGCGTHHQKWSYPFIHWVGEHYKFTSVCDGHDRCYGTCNTDRVGCDDSFYSGLVAVCNAKWSVRDKQFSLCSKAADIFYKFVSKFGPGPFRNAQNEDCWCNESNFQKLVLREKINEEQYHSKSNTSNQAAVQSDTI